MRIATVITFQEYTFKCMPHAILSSCRVSFLFVMCGDVCSSGEWSGKTAGGSAKPVRRGSVSRLQKDGQVRWTVSFPAQQYILLLWINRVASI